MFERFTKEARAAVMLAHEEAAALEADRIGASTCCSASRRIRARRRACWSRWASATPRCVRSWRATGSTRTRWPPSASTSPRSGDASSSRSAPARSAGIARAAARSRRRRRRRSSSRCARRSRWATAGSGPSTSCSA